MAHSVQVASSRLINPGFGLSHNGIDTMLVSSKYVLIAQHRGPPSGPEVTAQNFCRRPLPLEGIFP